MKPTVKVVEQRHRTMLLGGSGLRSVNNSGFEDPDDELGISDTPGSTWGR